MKVKPDTPTYQNRSLSFEAAVAAAVAELDKRIPLDVLPPVAKSSQVAEVLQTTSSAMAQERYLQRGIPYVKYGNRVRYLREDVLRYLAANRIGSVGDAPIGGGDAA